MFETALFFSSFASPQEYFVDNFELTDARGKEKSEAAATEWIMSLPSDMERITCRQRDMSPTVAAVGYPASR